MAPARSIAPTVREQELRNFLGSFNFPGDMVDQPVGTFSGGEKARLALALIVWQRPNLLLLDEPTNHLDLETREALTDGAGEFEGTLVLVSHDRDLLRAMSDEFIIVADGRLQPFDGDLDDYQRLAVPDQARPSVRCRRPFRTPINQLEHPPRVKIGKEAPAGSGGTAASFKPKKADRVTSQAARRADSEARCSQEPGRCAAQADPAISRRRQQR